MSKSALVTGGAGFIGGHLTARLVREGWRVRVLDDFSSGTKENLRSVQDEVEIENGDIRSPDACRHACRGVDSVFHLGALASVIGSIQDPLHSHDVNLGGTLNMLMAARDSNVRRFVFSSSAAIYGNAHALPTDETQPYAPQSPYATHKAGGEFYCRNFQDLFPLETVVLRYFNVFGPRQSLTSGYAAVIPLFMQALLTGRPPKIFGDGLQTRDFVYVENVVAANVLAATQENVAGFTFNIAGGEAISLLELMAHLERISGTRIAPVFEPERPGEVKHSYSDISRARIRLGFRAEISLAEGLERTFEAYAGAMPVPCG